MFCVEFPQTLYHALRSRSQHCSFFNMEFYSRSCCTMCSTRGDCDHNAVQYDHDVVAATQMLCSMNMINPDITVRVMGHSESKMADAAFTAGTHCSLGTNCC